MRGITEEGEGLAGMDPGVNAVADAEAPAENGGAEGEQFANSVMVLVCSLLMLLVLVWYVVAAWWTYLGSQSLNKPCISST